MDRRKAEQILSQMRIWTYQRNKCDKYAVRIFIVIYTNNYKQAMFIKAHKIHQNTLVFFKNLIAYSLKFLQTIDQCVIKDYNNK